VSLRVAKRDDTNLTEMHRYKAITAGERLFQHVYAHLEDDRTWRILAERIRPIGDSDRFVFYYRQHSALHLTCKLISAGRSFVSAGAENTALLDSIVEGFPWVRLNSGNRLLRLLSAAVSASDREISKGAANEIRRFARNCYICGRALNFLAPDCDEAFTAEHLWPSSVGGDSIEENLLPACKACNNAKGNSPSWVATDIHSLYLGLNPSVEKLRKISFKRRYALFYRAALTLALKEEQTLKYAFIQLGSWQDAYVRDTEMTADMFNLETHQYAQDL